MVRLGDKFKRSRGQFTGEKRFHTYPLFCFLFLSFNANAFPLLHGCNLNPKRWFQVPFPTSYIRHSNSDYVKTCPTQWIRRVPINPSMCTGSEVHTAGLTRPQRLPAPPALRALWHLDAETGDGVGTNGDRAAECQHLPLGTAIAVSSGSTGTAKALDRTGKERNGQPDRGNRCFHQRSNHTPDPTMQHLAAGIKDRRG